jgi:LmbE family N-acetylglucosaminyl deacetylase
MKRRIGCGFIGLLLALIGAYKWQPWEYDFFPRTPPNPNPWTPPEPDKLFAIGTRVAVITAHPDDPEFYLGGTLTKLGKVGAQISLIIVTAADKAYYPFTDPDKLRAVRQREQTEAASQWGANEVVFLNLPDGRLRANAQTVARIRRELYRINPEYIFCFDGSYPPRLSHQDHRRAGEAAEMAAKEMGFTGWICRFSTSAPNYVIDTTEEWPEKMRLLAIHKSQFHDERLTRIRNMVSGRGREDGNRIGVKYGEGLRSEKRLHYSSTLAP